MPENVNTSELVLNQEAQPEDNRPVMIKADHVSMSFNMASEQMNSLKEYAVAIAKRKLFFEEFKALDDVSFEVRKGDVFGIMGTNGSGKSTMLKIIAGVLEPTKGTCQVNGNIAPLIELGAGFDMDLSARENIYLNGALLGYSKQFIDENFDAIVEFAEVEKFLDMPLKNYSSGMVARIAFAIATVIVPEILVVDEVLSVGDFMFQKKCEDRITELIERHGVTVLIVSHNNDQIARLCNKAIWIEKGHERLQGAASMVCRIYGGLGGRTGSPDSEQKVFDALKASGEEAVPGEKSETIRAESPSGLSVKMVSAFWRGEQISSVVLAVDNTHINGVVGNSLAGALGSPLISVKFDYMPDAVGRYLLETRPEKLYVMDASGCAEWLPPELESLPWKPEVHAFSAKGLTAFAFSKQIYDWGVSKRLWDGKAIAVVPFESELQSLIALPALYSWRIPIFTDEGNQPFLNNLSLLRTSAGITRVYCPDPEFVPRVADALGGAVDTVLLNEELAFNEGVRLSDDGCAEIALSPYSTSQWPYLLSCGCSLGRRKGSLLLLDQGSLDSIAFGLDVLLSRRRQIARIVFIDGSISFDQVDKDVLSLQLA